MIILGFTPPKTPAQLFPEVLLMFRAIPLAGRPSVLSGGYISQQLLSFLSGISVALFVRRENVAFSQQFLSDFPVKLVPLL